MTPEIIWSCSTEGCLEQTTGKPPYIGYTGCTPECQCGGDPPEAMLDPPEGWHVWGDEAWCPKHWRTEYGPNRSYVMVCNKADVL